MQTVSHTLSKKLDGLPNLGSDITNFNQVGGEHYLFGALAGALRFLNEPFDYDYLMVASGCAFHTITSDPDAASDACVKNALTATGYNTLVGITSCDQWADIRETQTKIRETIDKGIPAIAFWPFPFRALIIGYDSDEFIFQKYWGGEEKGHITGGYLLIIGKNIQIQNKKQHILNGIRLAFSSTIEKENYQSHWDLLTGPAGFDKWAKNFYAPLDALKSYSREDETAHVHWNAWMYLGLIDARSAAERCLYKVAPEFASDESNVY